MKSLCICERPHRQGAGKQSRRTKRGLLLKGVIRRHGKEMLKGWKRLAVGGAGRFVLLKRRTNSDIKH